MDDPVLTARLGEAAARPSTRHLPIIARARDTDHAAALYRAGVTDAVPETLEASLQLSEAVLVDLGVAMGPVIASIHEKRGELRAEIMEAGQLEVEPSLGRRRCAIGWRHRLRGRTWGPALPPSRNRRCRRTEPGERPSSARRSSAARQDSTRDDAHDANGLARGSEL